MALTDWVQVDDRGFDQLFEHLRGRVPTERWTDFNPSDTGIALLELFSWLGEIALYRMGRVPETHRRKFLRLLIDPPEPVTTVVDLKVTDAGGLDVPDTVEVTIPAGTQLATDFFAPGSGPNHGARAKRYVFETTSEAALRHVESTTEPFHLVGQVIARERLVVADELLGTTSGVPGESFPLRPSHADLDLPPEHPAPVLLDFVHHAGAYDPNPEVLVGATPWKLVRFLRGEGSRVVGPPVEHFMVDAFERAVVFGDGEHGSIPPAGELVTCRRYQVLQGPEARIGAGTLRHVLTPVPDLLSNHVLALANHAAQGGAGFVSEEERATRALVDFRRPFRVITADDFRRVLLEDYRLYQEELGQTDFVARAQVFLNRRPPLSADVATPGHVTVLVLTEGDLATIEDPTLTLAQKDAQLQAAAAGRAELTGFLDQRRLITTHVHVAPPALVEFDVDLAVAIAGDRGVVETARRVEEEVKRFFSPRWGGLDGEGWRGGESVHRSRLYRLLAELAGVEHVEMLTLGDPAGAGAVDAHGDFVVRPHQLATLRALNVTARKTP